MSNKEFEVTIKGNGCLVITHTCPRCDEHTLLREAYDELLVFYCERCGEEYSVDVCIENKVEGE